jgi:phage terminase large subunit-like protein
MGYAARAEAELISDKVIEFCHLFLKVPEGKTGQVGKPLILRDWQQEIIRSIYDKPTRRAIISFGRKNGKTALTAALMLAHLVGPVARRNSHIYSAAQSRDQAAIVFALAAKMVRMDARLNKLVTIRDSRKEMSCGLTGVTYRALSADAVTAYGLSPAFIVHDELGQVKGPRSELYEALETAVGAHENPLSIIISTQAPTDGDLLSILIDDAKAGNDPRVVLSLHSADLDEDPFSEETIRKANPAFGDFLNADEVLAMAEDARRMPSREAEYRNLILNQRVDASSPFLSRALWQSCIGEVFDDWKGKPVYCGLDLSEVSDLTAFVMIAQHDGKWNVRPTFWLPEEGLRDRAQKDRVPYDEWAKRGFLETTPGKSIEYAFIAHWLKETFERLDIRQVAFDRWNWRHLKPWLEKAGFAEEEIGKFVEFGQGYQSMSPALRDLESVILNGKLVHDAHPVLSMCAANAVVQTDPAGNRKLTKAKSHGRIDGMIALAMAVSVAATEELEPERTFQMLVLG